VGDDPRDDAVQLALTARHDERAFAVLVRRHIRAAVLLAAQLLGDRDDAEDVVQDAFTIVHDRAGTFDAERPFPPWLFGIVRRLAQNVLARTARRARLMRLWGQGREREEGHSAENALLAKVDVAADAVAARHALRGLSSMQRACFELVALRDLSTEEVAAMHGIAESTVRQHVFRARKALRNALTRDDASESSNDAGSAKARRPGGRHADTE
jgi:RNA polymerase sigma-70 factor (ECF subfamily)